MTSISQSKQTYQIGIYLKIGVILSCIIGVTLQVIAPNIKGSTWVFRAFTTQSNILIAAICLVFLIIDLRTKGQRRIPKWLYTIKFMSTTAIVLTYVVFATLLSPLLSLQYIISPANVFLHNLTPILALLDFLLCDRAFKTSKNFVWLSLVMPLFYSVYFFTSYEITGKLPIPYFFLDYKKLGWFTIGANGLGVTYWSVLICGMLILLSAILLKLKSAYPQKPQKAGLLSATVMVGCSIVVFLTKVIG